jgi:hypothetical protein
MCSPTRNILGFLEICYDQFIEILPLTIYFPLQATPCNLYNRSGVIKVPGNRSQI